MHTEVEEAVFYPAARPIARDLISEALKEHQTVDKLIMSLGRIEPDDTRFDQQMTELIKNVEHHVGEEERELFPKVRSELDVLEELGHLLIEAGVVGIDSAQAHDQLVDRLMFF